MIGLAGAVVILALVLPTLRARAFRASFEQVSTDVEALRTAAERHRNAQSVWPARAEPGVVPPELAGAWNGGATLARDDYTLQWTRWSVVDSVRSAVPAFETAPGDAPPTEPLVEVVPSVGRIGGIVVYARDDRVLGELLSRYGRDVSFVRDTTWTLVLPERAGG